MYITEIAEWLFHMDFWSPLEIHVIPAFVTKEITKQLLKAESFAS